jgi:glycosyltransferase involved in cell wall biosynthesis
MVPVKIALLSDSPASTFDAVPNAQHADASRLAHQLGEMGHLVDVYSADTPHAPLTRTSENVRQIRIQAPPCGFFPHDRWLPQIYAFATRMYACCAAARRYDVVHANLLMPGIAAVRLKRELRLPCVITLCPSGTAGGTRRAKPDRLAPERIGVERMLVQHADRIAAASSRVRNDLISYYDADPGAVDIVPAAIDWSEMRPAGPAARRRLGLGDDEFVVLLMAGANSRAGVSSAIRAVGRLARTHGIRARLMIVYETCGTTDPACMTALAQCAADEKLREQIIFCAAPTRAALRDHYSAADVVMAMDGGAGDRTLEAMSCGTPVICAGDEGGVVMDSVTGFLVPAHDIAVLSERLARLGRNPELARAYGRAGIHHVRSRHSWCKHAEQMVAIYRRVLDGCARLGAGAAA